MRKTIKAIKGTDNKRIAKVVGGGVGAALFGLYSVIQGTALTGDGTWDKIIALLSLLYSFAQLIIEYLNRKDDDDKDDDDKDKNGG